MSEPGRFVSEPGRLISKPGRLISENNEPLIMQSDWSIHIKYIIKKSYALSPLMSTKHYLPLRKVHETETMLIEAKKLEHLLGQQLLEFGSPKHFIIEE